jgi:hypothetical protein
MSELKMSHSSSDFIPALRFAAPMVEISLSRIAHPISRTQARSSSMSVGALGCGQAGTTT